jgi:hypothetical protein
VDKSVENEPDSIWKPVRNYEPKRRTYDLNELIDGTTPENRHDEMDFGKPMGRCLYQPERLSNHPLSYQPSWSPDGSLAALTGDRLLAHGTRPADPKVSRGAEDYW